MRDSIRIILILIVLLVASLSSMHFAVTDSWYSDSEGIEVIINTSGDSQSGPVFSSVDDGLIDYEDSNVILTSYDEDASTFVITGSVEYKVQSIDGSASFNNDALEKDDSVAIQGSGTIVVKGSLTLTPP